MAFNIIAAKREGYTDAEIAEYLAERKGFNLAGAREEGYSDSDIVAHLTKQEMSIGESFMAGAKAEAFNEISGIRQIAGGELSASDIEAENLARISQESNPISTLAGRFAGSLLNFSTLLPGSVLFKGWRGVAAAGSLGGAAGGAVQPIYTEDDMGRLASGAFGAAGGAVLGGLAGKLFETPDASKALPSATGDVGKVADDIGADAGKVVNDTTNVADAEADRVLTRIINGEEVPVAKVPEVELPKVGDIKVGPDNQDYEFLGRQWVNKQTGRIATRDISEQLNPKVQVINPVDTQGQDVVQYASNIFDVNTLPKLPKFLSGAKPGVFSSKLEFETDIDKALYTIGNPKTKSKAHDEFVKYLKTSLGLPEAQILKLGTQVRKEVIDRAKDAQRVAAASGKTADSIQFRMSKALDEVVNPVEKHLDEQSKLVYNFGKNLGDNFVPGDKLAQATVEGVADIYKKLDPNASDLEMLATIKEYSKLLQISKQQQGRAFKARSLEDMLVNKHKNTDNFIDAALAGELDGC
jgi:hypothetical protein